MPSSARSIAVARLPVRVREPRTPLALAGTVALSLFVGWGIAVHSQRLWLAVLSLALLSVLAIYVSIRPDLLFMGWLFAAPFLQNSARESHLGWILSSVVYVIPMSIFVLHLMTANTLARRRRWYDVLPLAYLAFILASQGVIDASALATAGFYTNLAHTGVLPGVPIYYFCAFGPLERLSARAFTATFLASTVVVSAMAIVEHYSGWNLWGQEFRPDGPGEPRRVVATLAQPAVLGAFLGAGAALATASLVWDGPRSLRRLCWLTLAATLPALIFTYTRGGIVATLVVAFVLVAVRPRARVVGAGILAVAVALLIANWSQISGTSVYQSRISNTGNVEGRLLLSDASLQLAAQRPLVGWGYGTFDEAKNRLSLSSGNLSEASVYYYTSHDTFLTILVELGGLGLAIFLLPWILVSWQTFRARAELDRTRWFVYGLLGMLGVYVVTAFTTDMRFFSYVPGLAWIAVGLLRRRLSDETSFA